MKNMLDRSIFTRVLIESCPETISQDYCCHAYSLQVHQDREILMYHGDIFVDLNIDGRIRSCLFFPFLFKKNLLIKTEEKFLRNDDIVLYLNSSNRVLHSGRFHDGRIISKWGGRSKHPLTGEVLIGKDLYKHHFADVPPSYLNSGEPFLQFIRFADGVTPEIVKQELLNFRKYLKEKGTFTKS